MTTISALLRRAVRDRGPQPLITYYDLASGERTELSCTSFTNWVDKTVNLLDDQGIEPGESVALSVAAEHPGHWISLVWATAVLAHGGVVSASAGADRPAGADVAAEVIGPDLQARTGAGQVWACSLHPLGMGFTGDLPAGIDDYSIEVRAQPDDSMPSAATPADEAWQDGTRNWTQADLVARSAAEQAGRRLLTLADGAAPLDVFAAAILGPLAHGGSSVLVVGADDADRVAAIGQSERVD
ncbi:MAG: TIGR03089 family protein [Propionibacteriaceae bacterium]